MAYSHETSGYDNDDSWQDRKAVFLVGSRVRYRPHSGPAFLGVITNFDAEGKNGSPTYSVLLDEHVGLAGDDRDRWGYESQFGKAS